MLQNVDKINLKILRSEERGIFCTNGEDFIHLNTENLNKICRSCLFGRASKELFGSYYEGKPLCEIFHSIYAVEIQNSDGLPTSICEKCFETIVEIYKLRLYVTKAEQILRRLSTENVNEEQNHLLSTKNETISEPECETPLTNVKNKVYACKHCSLTFDNILEYKKHTEDERKQQSEECDICKKLILKTKLPSHKEKFHKKKKIPCTLQCETCGKKYSTPRNLRRHCLSHTGLPHVCELCGKGFREPHLLKEHHNLHSGVRPYLCSLCGKSFPTTSALRIHRRYTHEGKKPKTYPRKTNNPPKPKSKGSFPCEICGKVYASKSIVNYHVLTHSEEKKFQCNDCGKMFANKSTLGDHRRIHRMSYKCHICKRSFAYAASLETHINSHTGEKPHACTVCGKRYSNRSHMKEHMRNHTGERPYFCKICGKTFAVKGNLNAHLKIHYNKNEGEVCKSNFEEKKKKELEKSEDTAKTEC